MPHEEPWTLWDGDLENAPDDDRCVLVASFALYKEVYVAWFSHDSDGFGGWLDVNGNTIESELIMCWKEIAPWPEHIAEQAAREKNNE